MNSNEILMPALSPTMEEGGIAKWLVKEGDIIKAGDLIAEIETDKAIMEFESALDCKISKLLVEEGTNNIKVNTPIVKINDNHIPLPTKNLNKENDKKNKTKKANENRTGMADDLAIISLLLSLECLPMHI